MAPSSASSVNSPSGDFASQFDWHLTHGTQPAQSKRLRGRAWGDKEFASLLNKSTRTIQNWRRGEAIPDDLVAIEQVLFGADEAHDATRDALRIAYRLSQRRKGPKRLHGLPARISNFTGRIEHLNRIAESLAKCDQAVLVGRAALSGGGGVGKSSIASEFAYRNGGAFAGVWWVEASTRIGLLQSLAALGREIGLVPNDDPNLEVSAKTTLRRLAELRDPWLLVYDNVARPADIRDWLPLGGAKLLITSRYADWGAWAAEIPVEVWSAEEAIEFLQNRTRRVDPEGAATLAEAVGYLPLALDHAAAYCRSAPISFTDYADKVSSLILLVEENAPYPASVYATFNIAIEAAVKKNASADLTIAFLSHCSPDRIPLPLADGAIDDEQACVAARRILVEMSLVKVEPFDDGVLAIVVHRLVQEVARARVEAGGGGGAVLSRLFERLAKLFPFEGYEDPKSWPACQRLTPHALRNLRKTSPDSLAALHVEGRVGSYLHGRARYGEAIRLLQQAAEGAERLLQPSDPDFPATLNNLALVHASLHQFEEAEGLYQRAIAMESKIYGARSPKAGGTLGNLATLYLAQYRLDEAEKAFSEIISRYEADASTYKYQLSVALNNLGMVMDAMSRHVEAERNYQRSLELKEELFGKTDAQIAVVLNNLGRLYVDMTRYDEAETLLKRGINVAEGALGPEHPNLSNILNNLGQLLYMRTRFQEAKPYFARVLAIREKFLGVDQPEVAEAINNLATIFEAEQKFAEAHDAYLRALKIYEKSLGPDHPHLAAPLANLADLLAKMGEGGDAEAGMTRALGILEKSVGQSHPDTARVRHFYAALMSRLGKISDALPMAEAALTALEGSVGRDHPWTIQTAELAIKLREENALLPSGTRQAV